MIYSHLFQPINTSPFKLLTWYWQMVHNDWGCVYVGWVWFKFSSQSCPNRTIPSTIRFLRRITDWSFSGPNYRRSCEMNRTGTRAEKQLKISQHAKCRWVLCRRSKPLLHLAIIEGLRDLLCNCWACQVLRMLTKIPHKLLKSSGACTRQISIIPLSASLESRIAYSS